eukprot:gnl/MRDRNA2_/MRDRNA2_82662_c0_seq3.p2 gnl/MRDRNA2_/MRDRNA2_82662_c0~~gnl/MRDRNA2_/MRDRNA2_82662_c0_seq3.p2  ORF type:complete len:117 (+),score=17.03 gnl/MRDRNA2_/MRDRNA2_82662_c0_seq3:324-674(+)
MSRVWITCNSGCTKRFLVEEEDPKASFHDEHCDTMAGALYFDGMHVEPIFSCGDVDRRHQETCPPELAKKVHEHGTMLQERDSEWYSSNIKETKEKFNWGVMGRVMAGKRRYGNLS